MFYDYAISGVGAATSHDVDDDSSVRMPSESGWGNMIDAAVSRLYAEAGFDHAAPPKIGALALSIFTPQRTHDAAREAPRRVSVLRVGHRWHLYVHPALRDRELALEVALAIGDWYCQDRGVAHSREAFGAAILLPKPAFVAARTVLRYDLGQIAQFFCAPLSVVRERFWQVWPPSQSGEYRRRTVPDGLVRLPRSDE